MPVYTTRPDTLFGATYMVMAPEHPLIEKLTAESQKEAVLAYQIDDVAPYMGTDPAKKCIFHRFEKQGPFIIPRSVLFRVKTFTHASPNPDTQFRGDLNDGIGFFEFLYLDLIHRFLLVSTG